MMSGRVLSREWNERFHRRECDTDDSVKPMIKSSNGALSWVQASTVAGMTRPFEENDDGLATQTADPALARPPMYKVILHNDDFTPMEFVVRVLQTFFNLDSETAVQVMLTVHSHGKATCGVYTRDIAETKSHQVNEYARECQHPLLSDIEAAD